jgi:hypothetical protein
MAGKYFEDFSLGEVFHHQPGRTITEALQSMGYCGIEDVRQGYVSPERARNDYGVAVRIEDGEVLLDDKQTHFLRGIRKKGLALKHRLCYTVRKFFHP